MRLTLNIAVINDDGNQTVKARQGRGLPSLLLLLLLLTHTHTQKEEEGSDYNFRRNHFLKAKPLATS